MNESEYADLTKKFVHVAGRLGEDSVKQITQEPLPGACLTYLQMKVDEIKQVSGNRDVNNGSSASVTAASAIAALQEAGNGLSRDMIGAGYRAFRQVVELCIELIRQFYTLPRKFRILGRAGGWDYVTYGNGGLTWQQLPQGLRLPVFDIQVQVQKQAEYTRQAENDLAAKLFQLGVFDPARVEQSLLLLSMMEFKGKQELIRRLMQAAQARAPQPLPGAVAEGARGEHPFVEKARAVAQG